MIIKPWIITVGYLESSAWKLNFQLSSQHPILILWEPTSLSNVMLEISQPFVFISYHKCNITKPMSSIWCSMITPNLQLWFSHDYPKNLYALFESLWDHFGTHKEPTKVKATYHGEASTRDIATITFLPLWEPQPSYFALRKQKVEENQEMMSILGFTSIN